MRKFKCLICEKEKSAKNLVYNMRMKEVAFVKFCWFVCKRCEKKVKERDILDKLRHENKTRNRKGLIYLFKDIWDDIRKTAL